MGLQQTTGRTKTEAWYGDQRGVERRCGVFVFFGFGGDLVDQVSIVPLNSVELEVKLEVEVECGKYDQKQIL
jgi:hypothetical protein